MDDIANHAPPPLTEIIDEKQMLTTQRDLLLEACRLMRDWLMGFGDSPNWR